MKTFSILKRGAMALLPVLLFLAGISSASAQLASFTRTYGSSPLSRVGYNNSNMILSPYYGTDELKPGYLVASNVESGGSLSVKLMAIHPDGSVYWSKIYRGDAGSGYSNTRCFAMTHDSRDNGYLLTGYRTNPDTRRDELWLLKVDENGNAILDFSFSADNVPCSYGGAVELPCKEFVSPSFYGMDILQVASDTKKEWNGDFVIAGFLSEKPAVDNYKTLKRNFVWRFQMPIFGPITPLSPGVDTRFLKVFHSWGNAGSDNQPTSEDFANEIHEIPELGIMVVGHVTGEPQTPSPPSVERRPYYALMNYDGGGSSMLHSSVFRYAHFTHSGVMKNVRAMYGKDDIIYMLGYYYPTHSFSITPIKPSSGGAGRTNLYYAPNVADLPAFSMFQSRNNSDVLVVMGYRLGLNEPIPSDYVHPYTINIRKSGQILSKFNLETIRSPLYTSYTPGNPGGIDYFRPFEKVFPIATLPEIGVQNIHLGYNDAAVAGVLYHDFGSTIKRFHTTVSQFKDMSGDAECHPYQLSPAKDSLQFAYEEFKFNINNIDLNVTHYQTLAAIGTAAYGCDNIPQQRTVPVSAGEQTAGAFSCYPVPAHGQVFIRYSGDAADMKLSLSDVTGRILFTKEKVAMSSTPYTLGLESLIPGIYVITLTDPQGRAEHLRIIKE